MAALGAGTDTARTQLRTRGSNGESTPGLRPAATAGVRTGAEHPGGRVAGGRVAGWTACEPEEAEPLASPVPAGFRVG